MTLETISRKYYGTPNPVNSNSNYMPIYNNNSNNSNNNNNNNSNGRYAGPNGHIGFNGSHITFSPSSCQCNLK